MDKIKFKLQLDAVWVQLLYELIYEVQQVCKKESKEVKTKPVFGGTLWTCKATVFLLL